MQVGQTQVMGVLNVTPDSFSDGGRYFDHEAAVAHGRRLLEEGAEWIDVGGESTRPGAQAVPAEEELRRVLPVVRALSEQGARVSIDTRKAEVARAAVAAGARMVNDVSASLAEVAADCDAAFVAMHMLGEPQTMQEEPSYDDVVGEVRDFLVERADAARDAGVTEVWIDPGIGFGKTVRHNLELLANLDQLVATGHPVLVGASRKSTLGVLLARADGTTGSVSANDRLAGSLATAAWAALQGAAMLRAHEVAATRQAAEAVAACRRGQTKETMSWHR